MSKEKQSSGNADGRSSMGNYDKCDSFGQAFNQAHANGGAGHTFTYHDNLYNTNCKDGGDYRQIPDNRSSEQHDYQSFQHSVNATIKEVTGIHCQDALSGRNYSWTSDVDRQREKYHAIEAEKQRQKK